MEARTTFDFPHTKRRKFRSGGQSTWNVRLGDQSSLRDAAAVMSRAADGCCWKLAGVAHRHRQSFPPEAAVTSFWAGRDHLDGSRHGPIYILIYGS